MPKSIKYHVYKDEQWSLSSRSLIGRLLMSQKNFFLVNYTLFHASLITTRIKNITTKPHLKICPVHLFILMLE